MRHNVRITATGPQYEKVCVWNSCESRVALPLLHPCGGLAHREVEVPKGLRPDRGEDLVP